jgi:hypothetical protein
MHDLISDWLRWSRTERVTALLFLAGALVVPLLLGALSG